MIASIEYTLILYPKQNFYGENVRPIYKTFSKLSDIVISDLFKNEFWLYEIVFKQVEELPCKANQKKIIATKSVYDRVRLGDILL